MKNLVFYDYIDSLNFINTTSRYKHDKKNNLKIFREYNFAQFLNTDIDTNTVISKGDREASAYFLNTLQGILRYNFPIYRFSTPLIEALSSSDCKIPLKYLIGKNEGLIPHNKGSFYGDIKQYINGMWIEFNSPIILKDDSLFRGFSAYLSNHKGNIMLVLSPLIFIGEGLAQCINPVSTIELIGDTVEECLSLSMQKYLNIHEGLETFKSVQKHNESIKEDINKEIILELAIKCLIYLESGKPDLREWNPRPIGMNKREHSRWALDHKEDPKQPCILVGMDWKKHPIYSIDQSLRCGHWRWQACGKNWSEHQLIWIDETIVNYNKEGA